MASYNLIVLDIQSEGAHSKQNMTQEKYTENRLSRHYNSCVFSCLTTFKDGNKLCSSVSEPSSAFSFFSWSFKVSGSILQEFTACFPAALAQE